MRKGGEGRKHYRKCDNCSKTKLTPDHIFNCPTPSLSKIDVLPTTIHQFEDIIDLIAKKVIHVL